MPADPRSPFPGRGAPVPPEGPRVAVRVPPLFDAHVHLRGGDLLRSVARFTARDCRAAVVMPNLPAIETAGALVQYREAILAATEPVRPGFLPLMTLKLTDATTVRTVREAWAVGAAAAKVYPVGATTGSSRTGVTSLRRLAPVLAEMQDRGLVLCVHAEDPEAPALDREARYLPHVLWAAETFPGLRIVVEHISTREAVDFVRSLGRNVAATITAHHLVSTLDDLLGSGLRPHHFCYPVVKEAADRRALVAAATGGKIGEDMKFFLGSDSAPHLVGDKECACCAAGVWSAPVIYPILASVFLDGSGYEGQPCPGVGKTDALAWFAAGAGAAFYNVEGPGPDWEADGSGLLTLAWRLAGHPPEPEVPGLVPFDYTPAVRWRVVSRPGVAAP
jgi:dihydroorotase